MRTIIEEELYTLQLAALGDVERLDDILCGLIWALGKFGVVS